MMKTSAGDKGARDDSGPSSDTSEDGKETLLCQATALRNCLSLPGISILDKLIKTCPVWLQLNMNQERAGAILGKEAAGMFLVRKEGNVNNMVLAVRLPVQNEVPDVLEYTIKEEKSILYLEGSVLVFEDIFKLVAFYCVSRDLLPFTLKLPQAILEANSFQDLEIISSLGIDAIAESSLYKCVLKPLKEAINSYLKEIHNKDGSLQQLKENQVVIQNTTTTDLGVTTSVPETVVLEKILHKFTTMHKAYSPEKKIAILLKSCKLIYDSMAQGNPGTALLLTWYSTRVLCQVPQEQGLCYSRCGNIQTVCVWYQLLYLGVFGISSSQVVFRLRWLVSVKFSALIADTRCFLVNFKLHNSRDQIMSVSVYFMGNSHLAQAFMQLSINPQSSVPAHSSLMVTYRHGSLGRVS
uniref:SH2 domain-containing protein n=1 Tax=Anas platyrhynchos platyrhynchos TaxID=8840 RepID=A0A493TW55_ANAPP